MEWISPCQSKKAHSIKYPNDVLYRADLIRPLNLDSAFDVVVSCNTMSHLPLSQQLFALNNLLQSLKKGGDILVNFSLEPGFMEAAVSLLKFKVVQPIYFDSFLSASDESASNINLSNVSTKIMSTKFLPTMLVFIDKSFFMDSKLTGDVRVGTAPRSSSIKTLNNLPNVHVLRFSSDTEALVKLLTSAKYIF